MKELVKTLIAEFNDKEYAHAYMEEFSNMAIAAQIKVLREQLGLTQKQLAAAANMKQERISALEDVDYDAWTIKTLRKLARAFDLTIKVSFEKFSNGILDVSKISAETLGRTPRDQDLRELSRYDFGRKEVIWGERSVITAKPNLSLVTTSKAVNDIKYHVPSERVA
jgi:transcriptional regulator with XRE-family HTH domain